MKLLSQRWKLFATVAFAAALVVVGCKTSPWFAPGRVSIVRAKSASLTNAPLATATTTTTTAITRIAPAPEPPPAVVRTQTDIVRAPPPEPKPPVEPPVIAPPTPAPKPAPGEFPSLEIGRRAETPAPEPAPTPAPVAPPVFDTSAGYEIKTAELHLARRMPATGLMGEILETDMTLTALADCAMVNVTLFLPAEASLVRAEPQAAVLGRKLSWDYDTMAKGATQRFKVWLRADDGGSLVTCASIGAVPKLCVTTMVGKPRLQIQKTGPETALLGERVAYVLAVRNTGSAAAENVTITDDVPDGMSHETGSRKLYFNLGTLAPDEVRQGSVLLNADKRGRFVNHASVRASNADETAASAATTVMKPGLKITKTGPREQFLGKTADYEITVSNTGDNTLTGLSLVDTAAAETEIVSAPGATLAGKQALWRVDELPAGGQRTFAVTLRANAAGSFPNRAAVATASGLTDTAEAVTLWRGLPAMLLEMGDDPDPIQIGEETTYTIRITNQGFADDTKVGMTVTFAPQITPVAAGGATPGAIEGRVVRFEPHAVLKPKQVIVWTVRAKGAALGDVRVKAELTSEMLKTPVFKEEATQVY